MSSSPILHPEIPYVGAVDGGLAAGKMVKVQGKVPPDAVRFAVNYQLGPSLNPRDDIAIHVSPRFPEGFITRNHIESMRWGMEENDGPMCIQPGQEFEILILCDHWCYKIAINGRHFAEFAHRLPYPKVTHLVIDGDVEVNSITYEVVPVGPPGPTHSPNATTIPDVPPVNVGPPAPGGLYPTLGPQTPQGYGPPPGGDYGPPPGPGYGPPPPAPYGAPDGYNPPRAYGYQPGHQKAEEEDAFGGCLNKVGLAVGGLAAAGGVAAVMHAMNKRKENEAEHEKADGSKSQSHSESSGLGNLGALGAALATSLASNALQGNNSHQQGYPQQQSGGGDVLGSILGALGGGGGQQQQQQQGHPPPQSDPLGGAISSILGGFLGGGGGGGNQQPSGGYQPPGGYQPSGGYGGYPAQGYPGGYGGSQGSDTTSNLLSGIGSAVGSSLLSNVMDGFSKHGKDKSHGNQGNKNYEAPPNPPQSAPAPTPPSSGGSKMTADEISKGLGLD